MSSAQAGPGEPSLRDALIAAVVTVIAVAAAYAEAHPSQGVYFTPPYHPPRTPDAELLFVVLGGAALAWRRRYPRLVICVSTAATVGYSIPDSENGVVLLLPAAALFTYAVMAPLWSAARWTVGVTAVLTAVTAATNPLGPFGGSTAIVPADTVVAFFAGIALASRYAYLESIRVQTARQAAQDTQRQVDEERLRIARELHDVVAHTMATITVQAAAASQLLRDRPDEAAGSLQAIRAASKDGLRELRAVLDVLRSASGPDGEAGDPTQPAPGLGRLDPLVTGVRTAGLPVTLAVTGRPCDLPAVTDQSAFRIIQEALTNTLRHAGPAAAAVAVDYGRGVLRIEVTDTGRGLASAAAADAYASLAVDLGFPVRGAVTAGPRPGPAAGGWGHGLRGMHERAIAAGGTIEIGPRPGGGFRVAATLPLDPASAATEPGPADPAVPEPAERAAR
jgi:signal transduction histidine kinase